MAAGFIPTFGTGPGEYCPGECRHRDCAESRQFAREVCRDCGESIMSRPRFYNAQGGGYAHAACTEGRNR